MTTPADRTPSAARRHPKWAAILMDDQPGGTDSLFERIVVSVLGYGFLLLPVALGILLAVS